MTAPFPHHYHASLSWQSDSRGRLEAPPRPPILGGPPPEFGGEQSWWSPEHLLLSAAALCLMTTFFSFAKREGLEVEAYDGKVEGTLEKTREGIVFTQLRHLVRLRVAEAAGERALLVLEEAKKHCIVSNSLKAPSSLEIQIGE